MIHDLYAALCAHHPKSNHLPSQYIWPPLPSTTPPTLFLLVTTVLLSVCVSEFQLYIPHMSKIIWFLAFTAWLTLLSIILARSSHVVISGSISSFPTAEQYSTVDMRSVQKVFSHIIWKVETFIEGIQPCNMENTDIIIWKEDTGYNTLCT